MGQVQLYIVARYCEPLLQANLPGEANYRYYGLKQCIFQPINDKSSSNAVDRSLQRSCALPRCGFPLLTTQVRDTNSAESRVV